MATERRVALWLAAAGGACALQLLPPTTVAAAQPWWQLAALAGQRVEAVSASGATVLVQTPSAVLRSTDGGRTFQPISTTTSVSPPPSVNADGVTWSIAGGRVVRKPAGSTEGFAVDPGSPLLGAAAHLLAAPALYPGVVVAVAADGTVWRRQQDGGWSRCLLLLPAGVPHGVPAITALAAFSAPLTGAVYLATAGYSVLLSSDGGDDWIRAGPGLPDDVLALAADAPSKELFAGTSGGLFVHRLQSFPAPPVYRDAALTWRWVGIVAVSVAAAAAALFVLVLAARRIS